MIVVSLRALTRVVYVIGLVGLVLACFAMTDAFQKLPEHEDHILVVAIVVVVITLAAVLAYTRRVLRR